MPMSVQMTPMPNAPNNIGKSVQYQSMPNAPNNIGKSVQYEAMPNNMVNQYNMKLFHPIEKLINMIMQNQFNIQHQIILENQCNIHHHQIRQKLIKKILENQCKWQQHNQWVVNNL